jgi:acetoin utilization deacetylase AcuC-like enzyme
MLDRTGLIEKFQLKQPSNVDLRLLQTIHPAEYIEAVEAFARQGGGRIEADTVVSPQSYSVALQAAGAVAEAVQDVLTGGTRRSVCLVRPPGHHARPAAAMGFCLFGNVAVAARAALDQHELERVLIVDWDVHHGNGTQEIFYDTDRVHFFSVHRYPFYPGTGSADETGTGDGLGATWNLPLAYGTRRQEFHERFNTMLADAARACRPQLILISAGFDAHKDDPIGSLGLETRDFATLTESVRNTADEYCDGKLISVLEGGYNLQALADSVEVHLREMLIGAD